MEPVRPEFVPDASLSRDAMESLQRDIADVAIFEDDIDFDPVTITVATQENERASSESPVIVGVDQAFLEDDRAVSAAVALRDGAVIEEASAVVETGIPYIPGLLSFREGNAILSALESLSVEPDLVMFDGSGRIHFRQAGLATHVGVTLDVPAIGVAKSLLCGTPREPIPDRLPEGVSIPIEADVDVTAPEGTVIGHAVQSRQYVSGSTSINPLIVSPGHRVTAETAVDIVEATCDGYKLPEPTRLADRHADELKADIE